MQTPNLLEVAKRRVYRSARQHWVTERVQYLLRRNPTLNLPDIDLELDLNPGDVIIDCGANVGDVSSRFARAGATVYAFEPNPICFGILSRRFRAMPMVHCLNKGVMDKACELTLRSAMPHGIWDEVDASVASTVLPNAIESNDYALRETNIECVDLDRFIRSLGVRIRFLKLDIEGAEIPVLNRLLDMRTLDLVDLVAAETHERQIPRLREPTDALRHRIAEMGLEQKIRLDWP
jgi:FkbM family methyltransferase